MQIIDITIESIKPYKLNAKKHPQTQIEGIAESIKRFGFTQPLVVDKNKSLIIGHGRLEAAKKLNLKTVPTLQLEKLSETEIKALRLIDNRIAETGWDAEMLNLDLQDITFDFSQFNIAFDDIFIESNKMNINDSSDFKDVNDEQQFLILIECSSEYEQKTMYENFLQENIKCKLIM